MKTFTACENPGVDDTTLPYPWMVKYPSGDTLCANLTRAEAERVAACLNFCRGLSVEQLVSSTETE
jgi:hypothetical protein